MISSEALSDKYLHVNNCGRQYLGDANHNTIRLHGRVDFHMLYILSGRCHAEVRGEEITAKAGDAVLFRPGEKQKYAFYKADKSESLWIHFTGSGCADYLRTLGLYGLPKFTVGKDAALLRALDSMILSNELRMTGNSPDGDVCDGYLFLALAIMAKIVKVGDEKIKRVGEIAEVADLMSRGFREKRSVGEYAAMCHMSESRFEHVFKEATGISPLEYILGIRIERAKRLLETTDLRNQQIAEEVGFCDANYFSRAFKKRVGMSPANYRKS